MITFIKYPIKKEYLLGLKTPIFIVCNKIENSDNQCIVYAKENKLGFYCKSLRKCDIIKYKGGINIEKCTIDERVKLVREWYYETGIKLPRKIKKKLLRTKREYK